MKTKLLLTLAILMGVLRTASADHFSSILHLDITGNGRYTVRIDNGPPAFAARSFDFDELLPGHHRLRVVRLGNASNGHSPRPVNGRVVFDGDIFIPRSSEVTAVLDRGCLRILRIDELFQQECGPYCYDDHAAGHCGTPVTFTDPFEVFAISMDEFREVCRVVSQRPFESTRVEIACRLIGDRYLTSDQVCRLLDLFEFESNRLEVAKVAYSRTIDRERFFVVFESFSFDSSIRELVRYMENFG